MSPRVKPQLADLATTADIGRMLGISRMGAHQLTLRTHGFPKPIGKLGHYMIWWRPEIEQWAATHRIAREGKGRRLTAREKSAE